MLTETKSGGLGYRRKAEAVIHPRFEHTDEHVFLAVHYPYGSAGSGFCRGLDAFPWACRSRLTTCNSTYDRHRDWGVLMAF